MFSRLKTTIFSMAAVLLAAVLAMPHTVEAQGFSVDRPADVETVIFGGNNQEVSKLDFTYNSGAENPAIPQRSTGDTVVTVTYGDLMVTTMTRNTQATLTTPAADNYDLWCDSDPTDTTPADACAGNDEPRATIANKDGKGSVTITFPATFTVSSNDNTVVTLANIRLDVSGLADGADVPVSIKRGADATVPVGGGTGSGVVSGVVGKVAMGLKVEADPKAALVCSDTAMPTVTVSEGFATAWMPRGMYVNNDNEEQSMMSPMIKIMVHNLPSGGKLTWGDDIKATGKVGATEKAELGTLKIESDLSKSNGAEVVYSYTPDAGMVDNPDTSGVDESRDPYDSKVIRKFVIPLTKYEGLTGNVTLNVSAMLYPSADVDANNKKKALDTTLSFDASAVAPKDGKGENWLQLSECITYLLYPFITCGATPGWSTGISVANTTADGNIFGAFDEVKAQSGPVVMYGFPRGQAAPAEGKEVEPVVSTILANLMAGDTHTFDCGTTTMAGMEGYAIIKAGFQHARGMAFVLGNFADGAGVDVSHGYIAETIVDPLARDTNPIDPR